MKFLDFLFVAIFVIYLIRSLVRIVLPMLFQSVINKAQQQNYQRPNKSADSVKVDYIPQSKKNTVPDTEGEFVDYEEIK